MGIWIQSLALQQISNTARNLPKIKHQFRNNFTKLRKKKNKILSSIKTKQHRFYIKPYTHIKILAYHGLIFKQDKNQGKFQLKRKEKPQPQDKKQRGPKQNFLINLKEQLPANPKMTKNPSKISLLLQIKPGKSISKIPSEISIKQKSFLPQRLSKK